MITTSALYKSAVVAGTRKWYPRVTVTWEDSFIDDSVSVTVNSGNYHNYPEQVADQREIIDRKYFHLDGTGLDVVRYVAPGTTAAAESCQMGWWSGAVCDASGVFAAPYPKLTMSFAARPVLSLVVVGSDADNEFPVDFTVAIYSGATLLYTETVVGNTSLRYQKDISTSAIYSATSLELEISKWSTGWKVVKISEFLPSIISVYDGDDIVSFDILEEMEYSNGSLPIGNISANSLELKLQNIDDDFYSENDLSALHHLIKPNRKIQVEVGLDLYGTGIEYIPLGTYFSGDWVTSDRSAVASTTALDRMAQLKNITYQSSTVWTDRSLYLIAEEILLDAKTYIPDLEYSIDTALELITIPYVYFEKKTHFEALKDVAIAAIGYCYVDRNGVINLIGSDAIEAVTSSTYEITKENYFDKEQPAKTGEIKNYISVTTRPLVPAASANIYLSDESISIGAGESQTITCNFTSVPCINPLAILTDHDPALVTIASATYYAWGAVVTVTATGITSYKISISGQALIVQGQETYTEQSDTSITEYGLKKYDFPENHLVQDSIMARLIALNLMVSYQIPKRDINIDWRGDPSIELADAFLFPEYQKGSVNSRAYFRTMLNEISFNGGLRAKMGARKIEDFGIAYQGDYGTVSTAWQGTYDYSATLKQNGEV